MAAIAEDYVSFEVAKLLKEKGFDESCEQIYDGEGNLHINDCGYINEESPNEYFHSLAPTHQMAMKWLREIHKLHITILWDCGACIGKNSFCYHIDRIDNYEDKGYNKIGFDSNEEAVEAALMYCLENLI